MSTFPTYLHTPGLDDYNFLIFLMLSFVLTIVIANLVSGVISLIISARIRMVSKNLERGR